MLATRRPPPRAPPPRGLHSLAFRLNVSALCGIGGAIRVCLGRMLGDIRGCSGLYFVSEATQIELKRKRFVRDRGCIQGVCRWNVRGYQGVYGVYFVSETTQVELKSGRVQAPATSPRVSSASPLPTTAYVRLCRSTAALFQEGGWGGERGVLGVY